MGKQRDTELLRKLERNQQFAQSPQIIKDWGSLTKQATHVSILKLGKKLNDSFRSELEEEHKREIELLVARYRILREQDEEDAKERINAAYSAQEHNFENKAAEIRLECEQEMQKLQFNLEEQIETTVAKKSEQFQANLEIKLKEQKQIIKKENQMEIDRIKREQLNKHKEALQLMKSENKSRMIDFLDIIRRSKNEQARVKDLHFKDKKEYMEHFHNSSNKIYEKINQTLAAQSKEFDKERKTHRNEIKELEAKLKSSQLENERAQQVCRCLEAERDSLRKYYKEFVLLTRPDLLHEQSDFVFPWNYATTKSSCLSAKSSCIIKN
ncbi:unnamed protein product [Oikopleura dioica]|uniref:Coiled-coil domain-containing protein 176 n=1 Tax=Oikopleura dioica TaxID=34765 RepID=E4X0Q7_OIKDI|nr:unnamed protein product [Oikopleura dioica]